MSRLSALNGMRALIGLCTFIVVALGLMACGFIRAEHYFASIPFLIVMTVYVLLLRWLWGHPCNSSR
jgi:hypothetical protein